MERDWVGKKLNDRYEILELLGVGGMSSVYKASDPNLNRVVAVKIIHQHLSMNPDFMRRFQDEATAVAQLRHPHIVQVFDFATTGDTAFIVFEFVPGENLQDRLSRLAESGGTMPVDEITRVSTQIAEALDYAHARGLIHRDVKPANVILDVHGNAFLADFGIVKITDAVQHTVTGAVVGTARYMSPEQIRGTTLDGRTDLYSLGVTMFEMASGQPPYQADSAMTLMMMHVNDPVPDMTGAGIAAPLGTVIQRALAKEPAERYSDAGEMAAALRAAAAAPPAAPAPAAPVPVSETPAAPPPSDSVAAAVPPPDSPAAAPPPPPAAQPAPGATGMPKRRLAAIAGALAAVIVLIGIVVMATSGDDDSPVAATEDADGDVVAAATTTTAALTTTTTMPALPETVEILSIELEGGRYLVDYETTGYTEQLPGMHVHFYWNTIYEEEAGAGPNAAEWFVWGGPRPFTGYTASERPAGATEMCAVVANPDHTIKLGTGNCIVLP